MSSAAERFRRMVSETGGMAAFRFRTVPINRFLPALVLTFGFMTAAGASAEGSDVEPRIEIRVTPSVLELESSTARVEGRSLLGGSAGDEFRLGYTVENVGGDEIQFLATSIGYDPSVLRFISGGGAPILHQTVPANPFDFEIELIPVFPVGPKGTSPSDTLTGLVHYSSSPIFDSNQMTTGAFRSTSATGPDLAIAAMFEILDPNAFTTIRMFFDSYDDAIVNGSWHCGPGAELLGGSEICDVISDDIFTFKEFNVGPDGDEKAPFPTPEPTSGVMIALGLMALSGSAREAKSHA